MSRVLVAAPRDVERSRTAAALPGAVHLDLDGARHIFNVHHWRWQEQRDPVYENGLRHALDIFEREGIRATLFVIAEDLIDPLKVGLLREAIARGHEVASHTVTHRPLAKLSFAAKRQEIFESRDRIAEALGVIPRGFRAPAFSIDRDSLMLLQEAGYAYDSSVLPGRRIPGTTVGRMKRPGPALEAGGLLEVPLPTYRPLPLPFHPSYSLVLGPWYFDIGMRMFCRTRAPLVLLFHLIDFSDALSSQVAYGISRRVFTLSHLSGERKRAECSRMIRNAQTSFHLGTTQQLLDFAENQDRLRL